FGLRRGHAGWPPKSGLELLRRAPRRYDPDGKPDREPRPAVRPPAGKKPALGGLGKSGFSGAPTRRAVRRRLGLPDHVENGPASPGSDLRAGTAKENLGPSLLREVHGPARRIGLFSQSDG